MAYSHKRIRQLAQTGGLRCLCPMKVDERGAGLEFLTRKICANFFFLLSIIVDLVGYIGHRLDYIQGVLRKVEGTLKCNKAFYTDSI